jgi:hypothetical protein
MLSQVWARFGNSSQVYHHSMTMKKIKYSSFLDTHKNIKQHLLEGVSNLWSVTCKDLQF